MIYTVTLNPALDREYSVPIFTFNSVLRSPNAQVDWGGKGFNVSRMVHALGGESVALGFAGGKTGEQLRDGLESLGIETRFTWVDGETRTNTSIVGGLDKTGGQGYIKVNEPGPTVSAEKQAEILAQVQELAKAGDWWVLAGSLPPGADANIYAKMIAIVQGAGGRAILDTSGDALATGCAAAPFLAKPNDVEVGALTGLPVSTPEEVLAAAQAVRASGVTHVVISLGKKGAMLVSEEGVWQARPPRIQERNPIGAGDSMVGGLVYGLSRGDDLATALTWGLACGSATASLDGTTLGSRAQVEALLEEVEIRRLGD